MRTIRFFAAALIVVPVAVQAAEPLRVERDGFQLEYVVEPQADGSRLITGRDLKDNTGFEFHVRGRKVKGYVGGRRVAFDVPRVQARTEGRPTLIASK